MDGIYNENWYNDGDMRDVLACPHNVTTEGPCQHTHEDRLVLYANRLLGVPRLRQIRVQNSSCAIPQMFKEVIKVCYDHYDLSIEDDSEFKPKGSIRYTEADA